MYDTRISIAGQSLFETAMLISGLINLTEVSFDHLRKQSALSRMGWKGSMQVIQTILFLGSISGLKIISYFPWSQLLDYSMYSTC